MVVAIASFLPTGRLWGINHLAFYPFTIRIVLLFLMAISFLPPVARALYASVSKALGGLEHHRRRTLLASLVAALILTALFLIFRSSTLLLGDGRLVVDNFIHALKGDEAVIAYSPRMILLGESTAKGSSLLYYAAVRISTSLGGSPASGIAILNCILGGILIYILIRSILLAMLSREIRIWLLLLVLSTGAVQLLFGYVETYMPLLFFAALYLMSGLNLIRKGSTFWVAGIVVSALLTMFMHVQGILVVPSFVLLIAWHYAEKRRDVVLRSVTPLLIVLVVIGTGLAGVLTGLRDFYLPLRTTSQAYGVLSPAHWADILNQLLILLPTLALFVAMAVYAIRRRHVSQEQSRTQGAARPPLLSQAIEWHFAVLIFVPCLVFLIIFDAKLGMARDWDLFTITSVGLIPIAALVLTRVRPFMRREAIALITSPAMVMSLVLAVAWIGINASPEASIARFESILEYDKTHGSYAYETLAKQLHDEHRLGEAIAAMEKAVAVTYNPRLMILLSVYYKEQGRPADEMRVLRQILERQPRYESVRHVLVMRLYRAGEYDELLEVARLGTEFHPEKPLYHDMYGRMLISQGRTEEGIDQLLLFKRLNPPREALEGVEALLRELQADRRN